MHEKNISKDRQKYLKRIKLKKFSILATQIGIVIAFIAIWEICANKGIIDSFITSQPSKILKTLMNLSENKLLTHLWVTCEGVLIGTIIAILLWWSNFFSKVAEPFLVVLNSLPKVALGPIIIIWVGAGKGAIITMGLAISLIVTIMEILNGFLDTDKEKIKMAQTFNCSKFQLLTKIIIPDNIGTFINSLKINIGLSLVGVITGEFLVSKAGLRILNSLWRSSI